ncbi:uncharacterized protein CcaverHIS019_0103780 [Cutaneotrichosporon cavernicola]|uniref:WD40 repeat-like protein n=1 Tax=Cutaneotrichosporon cavernicola TaxID=279322 RepID=A0AA48I5Y9_9TREE|nr:uncharacterized protein CcaverHIS019_0103780 [Cutaneotrichosporon cavernicola]BEI87660.1 hypothetical protein CcaverHIS019_0103780 [Cutaneotrichosporon cavernicola]BEI95432.1 hypothetical protein CcaverHIS631_0103810 [Cutaneotrichosporon cavernicola]BEJ03206.1 hypothetical protein CcaverHIS641_0103810 [Cutaneotrichosporon cavernicola]
MRSPVAKLHRSKKRSFGSRSRRAHEEDEEEQLEARLFGSRKQQRTGSNSQDDHDGTGTGLGWMQDSELFTVDLPTATDGDVSEDEFENEPTVEFMEESTRALPEPNQEDEKPQLWHDPADDAVSVSLKSSKRTRKLARGKGGEDRVNGGELWSKLREQFERLHPKPDWASSRADNNLPTMQRLLASTASFINTGALDDRRPPLPTTTIDIQRLRNANAGSVSEEGSSSGLAGIVDLVWHPSTKMPVLATAGTDRRVRFYNIDGHTNAPLLTLHIPSLPLSRLSFHPSGTSLLITGTRPFYYTYDLVSQTITRSPRNLFGSAPTPTSPQSLERTRFSPDGTLLAVAGRRGAVSIVEWSHGGSTGVVVAELKSGRGGTVADLAWSEDSSELSVLGGRDGAEVEVWDVSEKKIVRRWKDDRAYGGQLIRQYRSQYTAVGSSTGIVNIYHSTTLASTRSDANSGVEPLKSLEHLTTPISTMAFHPSGELFVSASSAKQKQLKLYHLPTGTAFSNWPTNATPLGRVNSLGFSSGGEYMAAGNTKGAVLLWSLKHFAN